VSVGGYGFDEAEVDGEADDHDDAVEGEEHHRPEVGPPETAPEVRIVLLHFVGHFWSKKTLLSGQKTFLFFIIFFVCFQIIITGPQNS
jgi:hypothetical protein